MRSRADDSKISKSKETKKRESLPLGHPIVEAFGHFKFKITNPAARRSVWDFLRIFGQHLYSQGIFKRMDFPRCEKDETEIRYMPFHWSEQRDICASEGPQREEQTEPDRDNECLFGPSETHHLTFEHGVDSPGETDFLEFCSDQEETSRYQDGLEPELTCNQIINIKIPKVMRSRLVSWI